MQHGQTLSAADIREKFLAYFERKRGHKRMPSASLVPANNPTVLLTPAGMLPFVPIFLGLEPPPSPPRATTSQKCARVSGKASDLENVGRTPCHHTFFEMLGNFSFGDYFKKEVIPWAWEFVTEELGLPKDKLWVTVYRTDDEAAAIWRDAVGVPAERILRRDEKDNFWGPPGPTGPCGPCTEIYVDMGSCDTHLPPHDNSNPNTCDDAGCRRYMEIWNLVFMEFFKDAEGKLSPLEKKNVDTGMGLERVTMAVQGKTNTFDTDLLLPVVERVAELSGVPYRKAPETDVALKIIADHMRFISFAIADGVTPSNEGRGYILRMILRRAVRYGRRWLGFKEPFLASLAPVIEQLYGHHYTELVQRRQAIADTVAREEARFIETLDRGSKSLEEMMSELKASGQKTLSGENVFKLYDTFGFPVELTTDILEEESFGLDMAGFEAAMEAQREQARRARKDTALVEDQVYAKVLQQVGKSEFLGYDSLSAEATVLALIVDGQLVDRVSGTNQPFEAILDHTPFYPEGGGQVGDRGALSVEDGHLAQTVVVEDTIKLGELIVHKCLYDQGAGLAVGQKVLAQVEPYYRQRTAIHHTATHLLHAALKKVLGDDVGQAGSYVGPEGARFDFTFSRGMTASEIARVESIVNQWILENTERSVEFLPIDEARERGAIAMFDEKYGDLVRVVAYGSRTMELCGGTHIDSLGQIGLIRVTSEGAIASGVRRIEMVAGELAYQQFKQLEYEVRDIAGMLKIPVKEVTPRVKRLLDDLKAREKQIAELERRLALADVQPMLDALQASTESVPVIGRYFPEATGDTLRVIAEAFRDGASKRPYILVLASSGQSKAQFVVAVADELTKQGYHAGEIVKRAAGLCGGGGGGKSNFAQAGGKDSEAVAGALETVTDELRSRTRVTAS